MNEREVDFLVDATGQRHDPWEGPARIVSLVPSLTELVCELGLADQLVGRTGFCIHPRATLKTIPKVGGTKDVNLARLRELAPTHVIVNIDENRKDCVEEIARFVPNVIVTHPCQPEDNLPLYRLFGAVFGCEARAEALADELTEAVALALAAGRELPRERVLYLIWRDPWMTVAPDTYISASLAMVGWDSWPAPGDGVRYPAFDWDAPWLAEVDRVFLSSEPYRFRDAHVAEVAGLAGRPARLIDGEMTSWYGSRAAAGLRYLAALRRQLAA
ncbi:helical backbone metal receptor [Zoogloea sp. LCSB751]|uniref:helical backbone metal receptor n=1 Tax=Zoogloea sp. LCSB751 TaxID=1965277 RepID=UPI0020B13191|nr:helical backbone metal receptor [Zoogloea sp. LCSB751]